MKISLETRKKSKISGSELALLLVHGGPGMDDSYFADFFDSTREDLTIYSYTQGSICSANSMAELIDELNAVIDSIKEKSLFIVGHSFGSALATEVVKSRQDQRCTGLIWIAPALGSDWTEYFFEENKHDLRLVEIDRVLAEKKELLNDDEYCKEDFRAYLDFYFPAATRSTAEKLLSKVKYNGMLRAQVTSGYMENYSLVEWISKKPVPMCNIYGGKDMVITKRYAERFNQYVFRNNNYEIVEGGHFPFVEDPRTVCKAINNFISEVLKETK